MIIVTCWLHLITQLEPFYRDLSIISFLKVLSVTYDVKIMEGTDLLLMR